MTPVEAQIVAQERIRKRAEAAIAAIWRALPSYDEANVPAWLAQAVPVTVASQRASVAVTSAYLARALSRPPVGLPAADILARVRNGTPPAEVYRRPFVTVWSALKDGKAWEDAVHSGLERATSAVEMDVQMASRATFAAAQHADPTIRGYVRVPDAGACPFCLTVAGAFVKSADAMPLHNRCGCSLEPVLNDQHDTPTPDAVAVHEHGELGPVLAAPGDHFQSL